jgi:hypothetical protein
VPRRRQIFSPRRPDPSACLAVQSSARTSGSRTPRRYPLSSVAAGPLPEAAQAGWDAASSGSQHSPGAGGIISSSPPLQPFFPPPRRGASHYSTPPVNRASIEPIPSNACASSAQAERTGAKECFFGSPVAVGLPLNGHGMEIKLPSSFFWYDQ